MARYLALVQNNFAKLGEWAVDWVPRRENSKVDALAEVAATLPLEEAMLLPIYLLTTSSIAAVSVCSTIETNTDWTYEIGKYLWIRELPKDKKQTQKIQVQAAHFTLIRDKLYRQSFGGSYLKCLSGPKAQYILANLY